MSQSANSSDNALIQQLRQSLGMLQVAFDAATEAMLIVDAERQVHWANQAAAELLLGGVPIQLANRKLDDLMALKPEQVDAKAMAVLLDRRHPLPNASGEGRCRIALNGGEQSASLWLRWRPVELIQAQFLLLTFRDLSPDEQALIQQQRFMTDLTHELRTPLAIVNGNLQRLSRFKGLPSAARACLAMAGEEVDRIRRLIEHLSLLTRLKVDPALLAFGEHDLLSLLKHWTEALEEPAIGLDGLNNWRSLHAWWVWIPMPCCWFWIFCWTTPCVMEMGPIQFSFSCADWTNRAVFRFRSKTMEPVFLSRNRS